MEVFIGLSWFKHIQETNNLRRRRKREKEEEEEGGGGGGRGRERRRRRRRRRKRGRRGEEREGEKGKQSHKPTIQVWKTTGGLKCFPTIIHQHSGNKT